MDTHGFSDIFLDILMNLSGDLNKLYFCTWFQASGVFGGFGGAAFWRKYTNTHLLTLCFVLMIGMCITAFCSSHHDTMATCYSGLLTLWNCERKKPFHFSCHGHGSSFTATEKQLIHDLKCPSSWVLVCPLPLDKCHMSPVPLSVIK